MLGIAEEAGQPLPAHFQQLLGTLRHRLAWNTEGEDKAGGQPGHPSAREREMQAAERSGARGECEDPPLCPRGPSRALARRPNRAAAAAAPAAAASSAHHTLTALPLPSRPAPRLFPASANHSAHLPIPGLLLVVVPVRHPRLLKRAPMGPPPQAPPSEPSPPRA